MPIPVTGVVPPAAGPLPVKSLALFVAGGILAWVLSMAASALFPGPNLLATVARVTISLLLALGLVAWNRKMLARDGFPSDSLGLHPRHAGGFFVGGAVIVVLMAVMAGAIWLVVPFHYERGSMTAVRFAGQALEYFGRNFSEELLFRGYLLLVLQRHLGLARALLIVGAAFGLFHLPGLAPLPAVKMFCTTLAGSYVFACGFLLTRSLWTAVGLHVGGNIVLHQVLGLSGGQSSLFRPVYDGPWPTACDPAFLIWMGVMGTAAGLAALALKRRPA